MKRTTQPFIKQIAQLENCERNLFEAIKHRQNQLQSQLLIRKDKYDCELRRQAKIQDRNLKQQITNPGNQPTWMYLGNCIQDLDETDLPDIKSRQQSRQTEIQRIRQLKSLKQKPNEDSQLIQEKEARRAGQKSKKQQVPWKLLRKLRQQQVEQNKKRIEKQLSDKISKMQRNFH